MEGTTAQAKPARLSRTIMTDLVLPPDANNHGTIFGGNVMAYIDKIASITSMRHARMPVVTASSDSLDFLRPVTIGEALCLEAFVTWTHHTSMEVYVKVESENLMTGERNLTATSYLTFVALGPDGKPAPVPPVLPETDEEKWHYDTAPARYAMRKQRKMERMKGLR
ncbi:acyl-CoA thioesterase [Alicyclobacillus contaminans]|uniref:acyl-CoA thioesterase n=1 Tax=Alicyclobacillus contaminans TaxID=392016 RepID=UPI00040FC74C|nr:acyl-CoA thioesterase [Alicyclobacillus contaminans]GMA49068.1 acyl-CoA thioesterase [Alicyclobacillus contaminans]